MVDLLLLTIKALFFLEGLLLSKFSPRILLEGGSKIDAFSYASAYILAFSWIWFADRTRKFGPTLIICMILSLTIKLVFSVENFFYIFATSMIIPLTCAFTMMQCNPRQERELWALQYVWLIIGRFVRSCFLDEYIELIACEMSLTLLFIILAALIPWIQRRKLSLDGLKAPPPQVYTPLSKLLGQPRYLFFLVTVLLASFFYFFTCKSVDLLKIAPVPLYIRFITEIFACILSYFLVPHRIPPQAYFLISQLLISVKCIAFASGSPESLVIPLEIVSSVGFVMFAMANAQIVATHGKPGLEFTTCAFVDIVRNGIAPAIFYSLRDLFVTETILITGLLFVLVFLMKYFIIDYKWDVLIKKKI